MLPTTHTALSDGALYADHIELHCRISCPGSVRLIDLYPLLRPHGIQRNHQCSRLSGRISSNAVTCNFPIRIRRQTQSAPLDVYLNVNLLRLLHQTRRDYHGEVALDGSTNWVHPENVEPDNFRIRMASGELLATAQHEAFTIIARAIRSRAPSFIPEIETSKIAKIEITVDLASSDPISELSAFAPTFRRLHGNGEADYGEVTFEGAEGNGRMLVSRPQPRGRFKIYAKTNRRIRLECRLDRNCIRRFVSQEPLNSLPSDFSQFMHAAAAHVSPYFNALISGRSQLPDNSDASVAELITDLTVGSRNRVTLLTIVSALLFNGQVATSVDRAAIGRLQRNRVLSATAQRGYRSVADRYSRALNALRSASEGFFLQRRRILLRRPPLRAGR